MKELMKTWTVQFEQELQVYYKISNIIKNRWYNAKINGSNDLLISDFVLWYPRFIINLKHYLNKWK